MYRNKLPLYEMSASETSYVQLFITHIIILEDLSRAFSGSVHVYRFRSASDSSSVHDAARVTNNCLID